MRWPLAVITSSLAALAIATPAAERTPPPAAPAAEVARVREHLAGAEAFARARDLTGLTAVQRAARARHLERLAAYRARGVFPVNDVVSGRSPVFVDPRGVHCAVGHLLALDGETALVARIAASRNLARIRELSDEPELIAWLDRNGLTVEEAARIQPGYDGRDGLTDINGAAVIAAAGTMAGVSGILANTGVGRVQSSRDLRALYGLTAGIFSAGLGLATLGEDAGLWPAAAVAIGAGSVILSFRNRVHAPDGLAISVGPSLDRRGLSLVRASF